MKRSNKLITGILALAMSFSILTGCGSDPVADDFEKFLNTDMTDVNADYEELKAETVNWDSLETNEEIADSIENKIMPLIDDSLDKLSKINPETDEVKEIKAKYEEVINTYKEGYQKMLDACSTNDEATVNEAVSTIDKAVSLLDEYNQALESLAKEKDMEIQY